MKLNKKVDNIINDLINMTDTVIIYNKKSTNFILEKNNTNKKILTRDFVKNKK